MAKTATKSPGRKRRAAGWTLLTLGLLVAAMWVASRYSHIGWSGNGVGSRLWHGGINVYWVADPDPLSAGWSAEWIEEDSRYWYFIIPSDRLDVDDINLTFIAIRGGSATQAAAFIVLWPIPLLLCTPAAILLRSGHLAQRRANTNACPKCGYSLAGLAPDAPCPECGKGAAAG